MEKFKKILKCLQDRFDREFDQVTGIEIKKSFLRVAIFSGSFTYLEVIFHFLVFQGVDVNLLNGVLTSIGFGIVIAILTGIFPEKANRWIGRIVVGIVTLYYMVQSIYFHIFQRFLSLFSIGAVGMDAFEFSTEIRAAILARLVPLILLLIPFILLCAFRKIDYHRDRWCIHSYLLMSGVIVYTIFLITIKVQGTELYSAYDLYHFNWVQDMGTEKLGLLNAVAKDAMNLIDGDETLELEAIAFEDLGLEEKVPQIEVDSVDANTDSETTNPTVGPESADSSTETMNSNPPMTEQEVEETLPVEEEVVTKPVIDRSPNVLNIDFASLIENEKKDTIQTLHQYFEVQQPTNKNEYTGMFEGYNLILLTAEGFSPWAVDETITPTLYRLIHEGFVFENFYTPLWWCSTSDGEYVACTSTIPKGGVTSMYVSGSNYMPFCLGNQFRGVDYNTYAFHNHTYTYYHRDVSHPNMGYEYKGVGNGLDVKKCWPESDLEMMEKSIPDYIGQEPFHTYYMTVSGHMNYTFIGNSMSYKNREAVRDLPYSDEAKAYIACNIELDKALEYLIAQLEEAGIADKTVIALSADHYPYGLEKEKIDEIAGHEVEENFELYKNHFILWNPQITEPIVIDKACSSLDILPTLSNLFGLKYDSRLMMGRDILSDSTPLVMFSNRSFITDKVMYNSKTKEVTYLTEDVLPEDYVSNMIKVVKNKFAISVSILEQDYYSTIKPYLEDSEMSQEQNTQEGGSTQEEQAQGVNQ